MASKRSKKRNPNVMHLDNIPKALRLQFKAACARNNVTMVGLIRKFMNGYVAREKYCPRP
jgi:hypothetical protein